MSSATTAVVAVRMRKEREIVTTLRDRGAISQATATPLSSAHFLSRAALRSLVRNGAVTESDQESYFLNESAYAAMQSKRRLRVGLMVLIAMSAAAAAFVMTTLNR